MENPKSGTSKKWIIVCVILLVILAAFITFSLVYLFKDGWDANDALNCCAAAVGGILSLCIVPPLTQSFINNNSNVMALKIHIFELMQIVDSRELMDDFRKQQNDKPRATKAIYKFIYSYYNKTLIAPANYSFLQTAIPLYLSIMGVFLTIYLVAIPEGSGIWNFLFFSVILTCLLPVISLFAYFIELPSTVKKLNNTIEKLETFVEKTILNSQSRKKKEQPKTKKQM